MLVMTKLPFKFSQTFRGSICKTGDFILEPNYNCHCNNHNGPVKLSTPGRGIDKQEVNLQYWCDKCKVWPERGAGQKATVLPILSIYPVVT